jgi:hypothetical protein
VPVLYGIHHRLTARTIGASLGPTSFRPWFRGVDFKGEWSSTSPLSPGRPPPSNASVHCHKVVGLHARPLELPTRYGMGAKGVRPASTLSEISTAVAIRKGRWPSCQCGYSPHIATCYNDVANFNRTFKKQNQLGLFAKCSRGFNSFRRQNARTPKDLTGKGGAEQLAEKYGPSQHR